jgi:hypothetical protein
MFRTEQSIMGLIQDNYRHNAVTRRTHNYNAYNYVLYEPDDRLFNPKNVAI